MAEYHVSVRQSFTTMFKWELWCDGKILRSGSEPTARKARAEGEAWLRIVKRERETTNEGHQAK